MDIDKEKITKLQHGELPIFEPNLGDIVAINAKSGNLRFSSQTKDAVEFCDLLVIAVGTPAADDGSADLSHVLHVAANIAKYIEKPKTIVLSSTVPVGTADLFKKTVIQNLDDKNLESTISIASKPEFLQQGSAVADFTQPARIIIGTNSEKTRELIKEMYAPFNLSADRMVFMDTRSAELTKYAANAMLATKISFINEIASIAEEVGADIEHVRKGIGSDPRIGSLFIEPGCGYGGSCFPKDVRALNKTAQENGIEFGLLEAVENTNRRQKNKIFTYINQYFNGFLSDKTFALWGLSFKPNTDDMREAPSRTLMEALWSAGADVQAYDPEAAEQCRKLYPDNAKLKLSDSRDDVLLGADALVICTEWQQFQAPDFELIRSTLKNLVIFDGRNLYEPDHMAALGISYYGVGRGDSVR
jgi:UDPglucose 6-dehydrogenase